jgi:hypothetical protein
MVAGVRPECAGRLTLGALWPVCPEGAVEVVEAGGVWGGVLTQALKAMAGKAAPKIRKVRFMFSRFSFVLHAPNAFQLLRL